MPRVIEYAHRQKPRFTYNRDRGSRRPTFIDSENVGCHHVEESSPPVEDRATESEEDDNSNELPSETDMSDDTESDSEPSTLNARSSAHSTMPTGTLLQHAYVRLVRCVSRNSATEMPDQTSDEGDENNNEGIFTPPTADRPVAMFSPTAVATDERIMRISHESSGVSSPVSVGTAAMLDQVLYASTLAEDQLSCSLLDDKLTEMLGDDSDTENNHCMDRHYSSTARNSPQPRVRSKEPSAVETSDPSDVSLDMSVDSEPDVSCTTNRRLDESVTTTNHGLPYPTALIDLSDEHRVVITAFLCRY